MTHISDTLLPEQTIPISKDHILYDGKSITFISPADSLVTIPTSISGRVELSYNELVGMTAIVEGEFLLQAGRFYILRLPDSSLIKIPNDDLLKVVSFSD